jgi:hypothetical protein
MALPPHWLDDVFKGGGNNAAAVAKTIVGDGRFQAAVERAVAEALDEMKRSEEEFQQNPTLMAPSPEQAAREQFIAVLGKQVGMGNKLVLIKVTGLIQRPA